MLQVSAPPSYEWLKTLASVGVGVAVGVISALFIEPWKLKRLRRIDAERAEEAIYDELGMILACLQSTAPMEDKHCEPLMTRLKADRYEFYFKERREVFYAIKDSQGIYRLHGQIALNLEPEKVAKYGPKHTVIELISAFEYSMKVDEISRKRVMEAVDKYNSESDAKGPILYDHIVMGSQDMRS